MQTFTLSAKNYASCRKLFLEDDVRRAEVCELLEALNAGHCDSCASLHTSLKQVLTRLKSMKRKPREMGNWLV